MSELLWWSDEARAMVRPFRTFRELAGEAPTMRDLRAPAIRVVLLQLVIGSFVSFTTAGRLVAFHVANSMVAWLFLPLVQMGVVLVLLRLFRYRGSRSQALGLFFTGHGPWLLFMIAVSALCILVPNVHGLAIWLLRHGVVTVALLGTLLWGGVTTTAFFRAGLEMPRGRAAVATGLYYLGHGGAIAAYYLLTSQGHPRLAVFWGP